VIVGCPKEIKNNENRVGITPAGAWALTRAGHECLIEKSAGVDSGFPDDEYLARGAKLVDKAPDLWANSQMVVKVKEPLPLEYPCFRDDLILFTYLHLAPVPELTKALVDSAIMGIAYETVQLDDGSLPLLIPMSEVAGRMAITVGSHYLGYPHGGLGRLIGGVPGVAPAEVVIIGSESLTQRYQSALALRDVPSRRVGSEATWAGLWAIAQTLHPNLLKQS